MQPAASRVPHLRRYVDIVPQIDNDAGALGEDGVYVARLSAPLNSIGLVMHIASTQTVRTPRSGLMKRSISQQFAVCSSTSEYGPRYTGKQRPLPRPSPAHVYDIISYSGHLSWMCASSVICTRSLHEAAGSTQSRRNSCGPSFDVYIVLERVSMTALKADIEAAAHTLHLPSCMAPYGTVDGHQMLQCPSCSSSRIK